ncbi:winged helix-turn-helix transcriptional regulator [Actinomadura sp. HBU206391]|uniref:winged helix-turn-helix transcriptional regulator n=1 Tax=Actinomadura sp. HBU206391 TaxID=2731692 RepID=UPI00164F9E88|nr:helix-turn-helix transcriptional regulator [Actinomadura sp. HBU206391]
MLTETYQAARELQQFRATELAARLGTTPQNINNRLKKLVAAGAVLKQRVTDLERGGKEFGYALLPAFRS